MSIGYRSPYTFKDLPTIESLRLTNHVLVIERLHDAHSNENLHQYIYELMQGNDPRELSWFKSWDKTSS